jgi:hypothetical protein
MTIADGQWCMWHGQVVRKDGVTEVEVNGTVHHLALIFSPDEGMTLQSPPDLLEAMPARSVLEDRRARLLAPVERIPRDLAAREREFALALERPDVEAGIQCLRNLRASGASVKNGPEGVLFKKLLPLVVTPIAIGLDEDPGTLAALAGVERSARLGPLYR